MKIESERYDELLKTYSEQLLALANEIEEQAIQQPQEVKNAIKSDQCRIKHNKWSSSKRVFSMFLSIIYTILIGVWAGLWLIRLYYIYWSLTWAATIMDSQSPHSLWLHPEPKNSTVTWHRHVTTLRSSLLTLLATRTIHILITNLVQSSPIIHTRSLRSTAARLSFLPRLQIPKKVRSPPKAPEIMSLKTSTKRCISRETTSIAQ